MDDHGSDGGLTSGDDPFGCLLSLCHVSSSQEERLRRCPFAPERYNPENDESSPESTAGIVVASTRIVMVSLPESEEGEDNSSPRDIFHTPPEESAVQSSNEMRPTVDVGRRSPDGGGEALALGDGSSDADGARAVDLGRDSDLGFSEVQLSQRENVDLELNRSPVQVSVTESMGARILDRELSLDKGLGESPLKKLRISEQNSGESGEELGPARATPPNHGCDVEEIDGDDVISGEQRSAKRKLEFTEIDNSTEVIELGTEPNDFVLEMSNAESNGINGGNELQSNGKDKISAKEFTLRRNNVGATQEKAAVEHEQLPGVGRRLPSSLLGRVENAAYGDKGNREEEITMLDVLRLSKKASDDGISSCSILEICRRRGMTFPQPAWWPLVGVDFSGSDDLGTENFARTRRRKGGRLMVREY